MCRPIEIDAIVSAEVLMPPVDRKGFGTKGLARRESEVSAPPNPPAADGAVNLPDLWVPSGFLLTYLIITRPTNILHTSDSYCSLQERHER